MRLAYNQASDKKARRFIKVALAKRTSMRSAPLLAKLLRLRSESGRTTPAKGMRARHQREAGRTKRNFEHDHQSIWSCSRQNLGAISARLKLSECLQRERNLAKTRFDPVGDMPRALRH
jgi:hypothetical protein